VYRYEKAGVLHGMTRVRGFTQDDSHIFCTQEQVMSEVQEVLKLMKFFYSLFGFKDYQAYISTRPEKYLGELSMWELAEESLKKAAKNEGFEYKIDEGAGVFYGPKIDMKVKDSLGREWQLGTVQFDFNQPSRAETSEQDIEEFWNLKAFKHKFKTRENAAKYLNNLGRGFNVTYTASDGSQKQCVMIHRVVFGSLERFFGILIEHYGGAFPLWLAPVQLVLIPIAERHNEYVQNLAKLLREAGLRVEVDNKNEPMQARIRNNTLQKVPYMGIIGDKEVSASCISVRNRSGVETKGVTLSVFQSQLLEEIEHKV
jgi:threonyl-tRNA synthetase